jgi:hypothetical protein
MITKRLKTADEIEKLHKNMRSKFKPKRNTFGSKFRKRIYPIPLKFKTRRISFDKLLKLTVYYLVNKCFEFDWWSFKKEELCDLFEVKDSEMDKVIQKLPLYGVIINKASHFHDYDWCATSYLVVDLQQEKIVALMKDAV